jgi:hypothetical protein
MIYLQDNPLLKTTLKPEQIKNRLLGHWGASPGLSFIYIHLNRLIRKFDLDMIFMAGPGHGAPGVLAPVYLEGTYSEAYSDKTGDERGMREFFRQFSFPGGIGSHCTPETPGSIHEGGELGYVLSHACGAAFDNPQLIVAAVVRDGESETGPLATSWHLDKFLNPIRDGAVLPILHLNGYKINNPTLLERISHQELEDLFKGYGWTPHFVEGSDPDSMHQAMAATVEHCIGEIRRHQQECRETGVATRPRWPMIVLRSPKGWGAPEEVGGHRLEGSWRAHQVPLAQVKTNPEQLAVLEKWMRDQRPEELFDADGKLQPELKALAPMGTRRMSANPHANCGILRKGLRLPSFADYALKFDRPGAIEAENVPPLGNFLRDVMKLNMTNFRVFGPDETTSNKLHAVYQVAKQFWIADYFPEDQDGYELSTDGRVIEMLSEHRMQGMLEGFYYDLLRYPSGDACRLKVPLVGLLPLCATVVISNATVQRFPAMTEGINKFLERHPQVLHNIASPLKPGVAQRRLFAIVDETKLRRILARMLDENEFLSSYGIRSLSRHHRDHPYEFHHRGECFRVAYLPAESDSGMFGGNCNWRGPIWFPLNALLVRALLQFYLYYGPDFRVECPTGSGNQMTLFKVAREISRRLSAIFVRDNEGRRAVLGGVDKFQNDPHWRDLVPFYEYFHGDNGAGIGASHQTGWTGLVARFIQLFGHLDARQVLEDDGTRLLTTAFLPRVAAKSGCLMASFQAIGFSLQTEEQS